VNFSPDSRFMYAVDSRQMFVWQQQRADGRARWERAAVYPVSASFLHLLLSADGQTLVGVTYGEYGEIHLWHVDGVTVTPERVLTVEDGSWLVRQPAISDDAQYLAAADPRDGIIRIWQLKDGRS
jgi:WD40 repeat protein